MGIERFVKWQEHARALRDGWKHFVRSLVTATDGAIFNHSLVLVMLNVSRDSTRLNQMTEV